jgi:simple sugar transport system permease protein
VTDTIDQLPEGKTPEPPEGDPPSWYVRLTGLGSRAGRALLIPSLAFVAALVVGAFAIALTDLDALDRFGSEPFAALGDMASSVGTAYQALFEGAFGSVRAISETLFAATSLILAGLAVALGFRAGLFNIGANGQMFIGGAAALWVGIHLSMPTIIHIPVAIIAAIIGGGVWGGIAGYLRAKTGAHEVITTIMLNFVAASLVLWAFKTTLFQAEGATNPISAKVKETAQLIPLLGDRFRVSIGFLFAVAAVFFVYWLLFRSTIGFEFRAAGFSPGAATYAGMRVGYLYTAVMAVCGALAGVAGATMTIGLPPYQSSPSFVGIIGFDAITLALLGRSHPYGVFWAGILFGALKAGGRAMQGVAQVPLDLVVVMQALIVVFIAAPRLVRVIFRVKQADPESAQLTRGWGG